jgi:hypothetical protein
LQDIPNGVTIATLSRVPKYYTFRIGGIVQGKRVTKLMDGGANHKFIDISLVTRRNILAKDFEEFNVVLADDYNMMCTQRIRGLEVTLGNYTLTNDFYVMDLVDTHVVLGFRWLYSLGYIYMNYKDMRTEF